MNVLPLINKALALVQYKKDLDTATTLCKKAFELDPQCDVATSTLAQLYLQQGNNVEALSYFEKSVDLARSEAELNNALSFVEATRTQIIVQEKYPHLAKRLAMLSAAGAGGMVA